MNSYCNVLKSSRARNVVVTQHGCCGCIPSQSISGCLCCCSVDQSQTSSLSASIIIFACTTQFNMHTMLFSFANNVSSDYVQRLLDDCFGCQRINGSFRSQLVHLGGNIVTRDDVAIVFSHSIIVLLSTKKIDETI